MATRLTFWAINSFCKGSSKIQMQQGHVPSKVSKEGSALVSSSFQQLPEVLYIALLVETCLQSLPPSLHGFLAVCLCPNFSCSVRAWPNSVRCHLNLNTSCNDLIFKWFSVDTNWGEEHCLTGTGWVNRSKRNQKNAAMSLACLPIL